MLTKVPACTSLLHMLLCPKDMVTAMLMAPNIKTDTVEVAAMCKAEGSALATGRFGGFDNAGSFLYAGRAFCRVSVLPAIFLVCRSSYSTIQAPCARRSNDRASMRRNLCYF